MKQHGGHIIVEGSIGGGTDFGMDSRALPEGLKPYQGSETPTAFLGAGEWVLVVEDDEVLLQALAEALETLNLRTRSARNGLEALELFRSERGHFKLVLSDLVMPEMDGRTLLEELRRLDPRVKVIFMTGYPVGAATRELFDAKQVAWIQKPFTVREIGQTISRVFG